MWLLALTLVAMGLADEGPTMQNLRQSVPAGTKLYSEDDIHIVFSTDCTMYQTWQAAVFVHSALKAGQRGRITRIASGCDKNTTDFAALRRSIHPNYHVHVTPAFDLDSGSTYFPFYNKPFGFNHWLQNAQPPISESVIVLVDPDMIVLKPFSPNGRSGVGTDVAEFPMGSPNFGVPNSDGLPSDVVVEGRPVTQFYGVGSGWVDYKREEICGADSPALLVDHDEAVNHFSAGPPYMLHVNDAKKQAAKWAELVVKVRKVQGAIIGDIMAEVRLHSHSLPTR
jgi:hypothetical protein